MYPGASRAVRGTGLARAAGVGLETGESARDILLLFETRGPRLIPGAGGKSDLLLLPHTGGFPEKESRKVQLRGSKISICEVYPYLAKLLVLNDSPQACLALRKSAPI